MKKRNIILLVIITFLLTGCTFNYDAKIMLDGSVEENVNDKTYVKEIFNVESIEKEILKKATLSYLDNLEVKADNIEYKDDSVTASVYNRYEDINNYVDKSNAIKILFENVNIKKNKKIISLETVKSKYDYGIEDYYGSTISISLPYKVLNHNANYVDENNNTYTWNIDEGFDGISLEYKTSSFYTLNILKLFNYFTMITFITVIGIIMIIIFAIFVIIYYYRAIKGVRF